MAQTALEYSQDPAPSKGDRFSPMLWRVLIETRDCGSILYSHGVTPEKVDEIAESVEPGDHEFRLSWLSRQAMRDFIPMSPKAHDHRDAGI